MCAVCYSLIFYRNFMGNFSSIEMTTSCKGEILQCPCFYVNEMFYSSFGLVKDATPNTETLPSIGDDELRARKKNKHDSPNQK